MLTARRQPPAMLTAGRQPPAMLTEGRQPPAMLTAGRQPPASRTRNSTCNRSTASEDILRPAERSATLQHAQDPFAQPRQVLAGHARNIDASTADDVDALLTAQLITLHRGQPGVAE